MKYTSNPCLRTIRPNWPGTPLDAQGRFVNEHKPFKASFAKVLRWQLTPNPQREEKKRDKWRPPVVTDGRFLTYPGDMLAWLGHATFVIRLAGKTFITDPVFWGTSFIRREILMPVAPENLRKIDYLLLSHGHMDHCDQRSLKLLAGQNPQMRALMPLNMESLVAPWMSGQAMQEAGWYQEYHLPGEAVRVFMLPALHWYKRTPFDDNRRLWGSFILQTSRVTIYFGGDTGYDAHFRQIAQLFPQIDIAILGVGAYSPPFMMQDNHMNPAEAVRGSNELNARTFIPMHYGTFDLSDEPLGEPARWLHRLELEGAIRGKLEMPDVGATFTF